MQITLESDYAVRIVERLAQSGTRLDAHTIAQTTYVPLRFALKILRKLVQAGLVKSYQGAKGGYQLSREPNEITLRQVIEAVEGPWRISRCVGDGYQCAHAPCRVHRVYEEITDLVRQKLDSFTFEIPEELQK